MEITLKFTIEHTHTHAHTCTYIKVLHMRLRLRFGSFLGFVSDHPCFSKNAEGRTNKHGGKISGKIFYNNVTFSGNFYNFQCY